MSKRTVSTLFAPTLFAIVIAVAALIPAIATAHHGWSGYDEKKAIQVTSAV